MLKESLLLRHLYLKIMRINLKKRVLCASMIGNAVEYYDFVLYAVFSSLFSHVFFPSFNPIVSFLLTWGSFAIAFIMRPIGALIFGHIASKEGSKKAFTSSLLLTCMPMFIVSIMPSYESIGIMAPCMIIIARMIQGLSMGGEQNGAAIFVLEHLDITEKSTLPGMHAGMMTAASGIGAFTAFIMGGVVMYFDNIEWLWRVPFALGAYTGFIGFYIRKNLHETQQFKEFYQKIRKHVSLINILKNHTKSCLFTMTMGALSSGFTYTLIVFLNIYMVKYLKSDITNLPIINLIGISSFIISAPLFGYISDHFNIRNYFLCIFTSILILLPYAFSLLQINELSSILFAYIFLGIMLGSITGPQHALFQKIFPIAQRYTAISFSYCLGAAVFGGCSPIILTFLIKTTGNLDMPVLFLSSATLFTIASLAILGPIKNGYLSEFHLRENSQA